MSFSVNCLSVSSANFSIRASFVLFSHFLNVLYVGKICPFSVISLAKTVPNGHLSVGSAYGFLSMQKNIHI